jgi:type IV pilus assembly protein PilV
MKSNRHNQRLVFTTLVCGLGFNRRKSPVFSGGFTLVEVLVAVLILAIGILGMAGMQAVGVRESQNAYFRTQADMLVNDLVDKMRANREIAVDGSIASVYAFNGGVVEATDCTSVDADCSAEQLARYDLLAWQQTLQRSQLPGVVGTVGRVAGSDATYTIKVMWDEERNGAEGQGCNLAAAGDLACVQLVVQL